MAFPPTFADLTASVISLVRLDTTADTSKVQDAINTAYYEACIECEIAVASTTLALTAGTATYDISTVTPAIARIKDLWLSATGVVSRPPKQVSIDKILKARQSSSGVTVTADSIFWYSLTGQNVLDVYPTPTTGITMNFIYVGYPTALTGTAVPVIPEPYGSNVITYGACIPMAEFKSDPQLVYFQQQQEEWMSKLRRHLVIRRGMPGAFEYDFQNGYWPPHDPATIYPWT